MSLYIGETDGGEPLVHFTRGTVTDEEAKSPTQIPQTQFHSSAEYLRVKQIFTVTRAIADTPVNGSNTHRADVPQEVIDLMNIGHMYQVVRYENRISAGVNYITPLSQGTIRPGSGMFGFDLNCIATNRATGPGVFITQQGPALHCQTFSGVYGSINHMLTFKIPTEVNRGFVMYSNPTETGDASWTDNDILRTGTGSFVGAQNTYQGFTNFLEDFDDRVISSGPAYWWSNIVDPGGAPQDFDLAIHQSTFWHIIIFESQVDSITGEIDSAPLLGEDIYIDRDTLRVGPNFNMDTVGFVSNIIPTTQQTYNHLYKDDDPLPGDPRWEFFNERWAVGKPILEEILSYPAIGGNYRRIDYDPLTGLISSWQVSSSSNGYAACPVLILPDLILDSPGIEMTEDTLSLVERPPSTKRLDIVTPTTQLIEAPGLPLNLRAEAISQDYNALFIDTTPEILPESPPENHLVTMYQHNKTETIATIPFPSTVAEDHNTLIMYSKLPVMDGVISISGTFGGTKNAIITFRLRGQHNPLDLYELNSSQSTQPTILGQIKMNITHNPVEPAVNNTSTNHFQGASFQFRLVVDWNNRTINVERHTTIVDGAGWYWNYSNNPSGTPYQRCNGFPKDDVIFNIPNIQFPLWFLSSSNTPIYIP